MGVVQTQNDDKFTELQTIITSLTTEVKQINNSVGNKTAPTNATPYKKINNSNYCWYHGFDIDDEHTSATCRNKKPGHIVSATKDDIKGGKLYNKYKLPQLPSS